MIDSRRQSRLRGAVRHRVRHRDARTYVAILSGEKEDDLPKDGVREIVDAVHPRFYRFLGSSGGGVAASPRVAGCGIYNRRRRWWEPHLLGGGVIRLHFPRGRRVALTDLSKVTNDEPSCSASKEEGELEVFCGSEEEGELGFSVGVR